MTTTWFDQLPSGWIPRRVKTISPVMRGASPRPIDDPAYFDDSGEFAWVRISDVTASNGLLVDTTQRLSELGVSKSVKLKTDELFLSIAGSVGKPCITGIKACIHDGFVHFPFLPRESQKFIYWIFEGRECFAGLGKLGTQLNLNTETVGNISIPFPPLETQKDIAEFLDRETARVDRLAEKKQRMVDVLSAKRSSEILAAVTFSLNRETATKQSTINSGEYIPAHWEELRLSTVCRFFQGKAHEPYFNEDGPYVPITARFISTNGERAKRCSKNLSPAHSGDILMVMSDLPNGRALARSFLVTQNDTYAVNQRVCALTPQFGDSRFYYYQLNRNDQLLRYNDGFNQTHLKNRYFQKMILRVPPVGEQVLVADYLDRKTARVDEVNRKIYVTITRLRDFRAALITAAVTGQINVTTWGKKGQTDRRLDQIEEAMRA